jgi:hypothetical protein
MPRRAADFPVTLTTFRLNAWEVQILMIALNGKGGFQSFGRTLQRRVDENGTLHMSDAEVGRVFRYAAYARADGGFEGRCRKVFGRSLSAPFLIQPGLPGLAPEDGTRAMPDATSVPIAAPDPPATPPPPVPARGIVSVAISKRRTPDEHLERTLAARWISRRRGTGDTRLDHPAGG